MPSLSQILSQGVSPMAAPPPNFSMLGGAGANCGPCGGNPWNQLPENAPSQSGCNPANPSNPYDPNIFNQPYHPVVPQGGLNPLNPVANNPIKGQPIWPAPVFPTTGMSPKLPINTIPYSPSPIPPLQSGLQPFQPITNPIRTVPSCGITYAPSMPYLPVAPATFVGWNLLGANTMPYQNYMGTGIPPTPALTQTKVNVIPVVVRPTPYLFTPKPLPSEILPSRAINGGLI